MVDILRAVSKEMADFKMHSRAFQSQMLSLQDILANKTQKCFEDQKNITRYKSFIESGCQLVGGVYAWKGPEGQLHKMISEMIPKIGQVAASAICDPWQLDEQNTMRKIDTFSQHTQRIVQALDQIKQTQDSAEQTLQQSRQNAHS